MRVAGIPPSALHPRFRCQSGRGTAPVPSRPEVLLRPLLSHRPIKLLAHLCRVPSRKRCTKQSSSRILPEWSHRLPAYDILYMKMIYTLKHLDQSGSGACIWHGCFLIRSRREPGKRAGGEGLSSGREPPGPAMKPRRRPGGHAGGSSRAGDSASVPPRQSRAQVLPPTLPAHGVWSFWYSTAFKNSMIDFRLVPEVGARISSPPLEAMAMSEWRVRR